MTTADRPAAEQTALPPAALAWLQRRSSSSEDWPLQALLERKAAGGHRVSVVIPARNEERSVGEVVALIRHDLVDGAPLVDELVVIDSDSTDATARVARAAGATVRAAAQIRPDLGTFRGKGEALWKSQFVTTGDLLVFVDADLTHWGTHFVTGLLGPLLTDPDVLLVKGFYDRLLEQRGAAHSTEGGRVTELVARPLLNLWWPHLAPVVQPLAGEWAIRAAHFCSLPVPTAYGVELATLIDTATGHGLDAVAQVDLGARAHHHQKVHDLALMAAELLVVADRRRPDRPAHDPASPPPGPPGHDLHQHVRDDAVGSRSRWRVRPVPTSERPPAASVADPPGRRGEDGDD